MDRTRIRGKVGRRLGLPVVLISAPAARRVLQGRAAAWHEEHATLDEALDYARASGDLDRAARIVCGHVQDYARRGALENLRVRLEGWTEQEIESDPRFALGAGWAYLHLGGAALAGRYAAAAGRGNLDQPCPSGASSLRSTLAILRGTAGTGGVNQMLTDGMFVSAMERPAGTRRAYAGCRITGVAQVPGHEITITRRLPASRVITRSGQRRRQQK